MEFTQQNTLLRRCLRSSLLLLIAWSGISAFGQSISSALHLLELPLYQGTGIILPYQANADRDLAIRSGMNELEAGMSTSMVIDLMGPPDEVEPVFRLGTRTPQLRAFRYIYLFKREKSDVWGEKYRDQLVTVSFNLNDRMIAVQGYAVPELKEIIREQGLNFKFEMSVGERVKLNDLLLRLEDVHEAGVPKSAESSDPAADGRQLVAVFSTSLPDRTENVILSMSGVAFRRANSHHCGPYKVTLLAVTAEDQVLLIVQ